MFKYLTVPAGLLLLVYVVFMRRPLVEVMHPFYGDAVQAVYATGVVEPVHWAKVSPVVEGIVAEVMASEGDEVKAGQELARLDDAQIKAEIAMLQASAKTRKNDLDRNEALLKGRVVSTQEYEQAKRAWDEISAQINSYQARLNNLVLRAPEDGKVLREDAELGEVAKSGQALFWVGRERPLWVTADVDEENAPLVSTGQKVLITSDAFPGKSLPGTVQQITPKGDPQLKTFRVRIALPDNTLLLIGMTAEVNIIVSEKKKVLLVPAVALAGDSLLMVKGGRLRHQPVKVGIRGGEYSEIVEGATEADLVLKTPSTLSDGKRIRSRLVTSP